MVSTNLNPALVQLFMSWRPKWIIWDAWLTLWISNCREPIGLLQWEFDKSLQISPVNYHPTPTPQFLQWCLTNPTANPEQFILEAAREFGWNVNRQNVQAFEAIVDAERSCVALLVDAEPTLQAAQDLGFVNQGVISNLWPFPAFRLFEDNTAARYIRRENIVCSYEERRAKPDPEIFLTACRRFNVKPEDCLMIGDNVSADIEGALRVGMKAALIDRLSRVTGEQLLALQDRVRIDRGEEVSPVLYMRDLRELIDYLKLCPKV